ncbi:MAG TPA: hypothetical protein PLZ36_00555 [Armatimonadota bacterium]|nr:hypothetical protein [Armatimonadota bacterium]HOS42996.1 hypothetical protein [Armatimonadota bacterium]
MAHALRLKTEEPSESRAAEPRYRRAARPAPTGWRKPLPLTGLILVVVGVLMLFIRCSDCIAQHDLRAQSLRQELAQLDRECVQLHLELYRMAAEPQLSRITAQHKLVLPTPARTHYATVKGVAPETAVAQAGRPAPARSGQVMVAGLQEFWRKLVPTPAAYAQD